MVRLVVVAAALALLLPSAAAAVPPALSSVSVSNRHPEITFSAPKADSVYITIASKPDRSTDGSFLQENVKGADILTDSEIQTGHWLSEAQVDPGTYWLILQAFPAFGQCYIYDAGTYDDSCAQGYSAVAQLIVPKPPVRYSATIQVLRLSGRAFLVLKASPLGQTVPYKLCYRNAVKARRCLRGTLDGYSWGSSATDRLSLSTRGLAQFTTFEWFVGVRKVAQKRVRVR